MNFFATGRFLKHCSTGLPYEIFWHCGRKIIRRKILILPPLFSINFFATGKFLKHCTKRLPYEIFRHSDRKFFRQKNLDVPPLLSINFFATGKFLKHRTEGLLYEIFRHWETKIFRRNIVFPPSLIPKFFRYLKLMKQQKIPLRNFSALGDENFSTKYRVSPLLLSLTFFDT